MTRLSVVVPAFNEAQRLGATLDRVLAHLGATPEWCPAEVIVVDDGSSDETSSVASGRAPAGASRIVVCSHPCNRGKGAAVRTGFAASRGQWVLLTDADLAAPIEEIDHLAAVSDPRTVAIGSRAVDRRRIQVRQPLHRDFMGRIFNLGVRLLVVPGVFDTQCGFKLFPGRLARALASVQSLDGFAYDVELLMLARHWGCSVVEVPVRWSHVEDSRVSPLRHSAQMLRDLLTLAGDRALGRLPPAPDTLDPAEVSEAR